MGNGLSPGPAVTAIAGETTSERDFPVSAGSHPAIGRGSGSQTAGPTPGPGPRSRVDSPKHCTSHMSMTFHY
jgi:hypothetical protein